MNTDYEPAPYMRISNPRQIKAFSDPLRVRIVRILGQRAATNQQLASELEVQPAKLLHHLRFLIDAGLVKLVDQQVSGGNVEKYYRATSRLYGLDPDPESSTSLAASVLESAVAEAIASATLWTDTALAYEGRRARISPARRAEFEQKLNQLIDDYWGGPHSQPAEDPDADIYALMTVVYRFPGEQS